MESKNSLLNPWGPWKNNPSDPQNFYDTNESFEEDSVSSKDEDTLNEEIIEEIINEVKDSSHSSPIIPEIEDPYSLILKDLK